MTTHRTMSTNYLLKLQTNPPKIVQKTRWEKQDWSKTFFLILSLGQTENLKVINVKWRLRFNFDQKNSKRSELWNCLSYLTFSRLTANWKELIKIWPQTSFNDLKRPNWEFWKKKSRFSHRCLKIASFFVQFFWVSLEF